MNGTHKTAAATARRVGPILLSSTFAVLAALETLAWAQAPAPDAPADSRFGIGMALAAMAVFLLVVIAAVKLFDWKRRRDEDDMALEARVSDALMTDPALNGQTVTAHIHRAGLRDSAPTHVEVTGTVTSPAMREAALALVKREVLPERPGAQVESRVAIDETARRAA